MSKQRIGILGGSFDPVHCAHIQMGQYVLDHGYIDQLIVIPTGSPVYKTCSASAEDRWKMVVSACACDQRLIPSRLEIDRPAPVYAIDTLEMLHAAHPKAKLYYLIGADVVMTLSRWHRFQDVSALCAFLVFPRSGISDSSSFRLEAGRLTDLGIVLKLLPEELSQLSSSGIRSELSCGRVPESLTPDIAEYCHCKGLYGLPGRLENIDAWMDSLFSALKPSRFAHSLSVACTARRLAGIHGLDLLKAEQAGLLHDCAKCIPLEAMRQIAVEQKLTDDEGFLSSGSLLHSVVGAWVAEHHYGITDPEVLEAISFHNTGHAGMSRLAMCVCLADSIEPLRKAYPQLEQARILADHSLEEALLLSLETTASYVRSKGKFLHPRTVKTISWLKSLLQNS